MAQRIFLSYRRSDTSHHAGALKIVLENKLRDVSVFVDTESINPSERWPDRLSDALEDSSAVIALIGPTWRFGPDGSDRFDDPDDWVRREVTYGLENREGAFIPVLIGTTAEHAYRSLQPSMAGLVEIQAHQISSDARWAHDVDRLASLVAKILKTTRVGGAIKFPSPSELKRRAPRLTEAEFDEHKQKITALTGWVFSRVTVSTPEGEIEGTEISHSFTFVNFRRAFTFMTRIAELAESRPHHPDWTNVWSRVDVRLRTYDADQSVTWYDIEMACAMHAIASEVTSEDVIGWPLRPSP